MKTSFLFAVGIAAGMVSTGCTVNIHPSAGTSHDELKATADLTQNAAIPSGITTLEVDNRYGTVRISGTDKEQTGWSQKLSVRARTEEIAQQAAKEASCQAQLDGDRLKLSVLPPKMDERYSFQSDLEIVVPKSVSVRVRNRYGAIAVSDLNGNVDVTGQSGAVEIHNISGRVQAQNTYAALKVSNTGPASLKNQSGSIDASGIAGSLDAETRYASLVARDIRGEVKLRNQSGRIEAGNTGAADIKTSYASLEAKNINGDATLVNQSGQITASEISGSVKAKTSYATMDIAGGGPSFICNNQSGGIRLSATSTTLTNLEANTSYAALEVRLPSHLSPTIHAQTSYAAVESDFPILTKPANHPVSDLRPGTPQVNLQNQSGKIRVVRE